MDNLSNIEKLRWRCYKIIPLVFDEALSYYEVLCKGAKKTNEIIDFIDEMAEQVEANKNDIAEIKENIGTGSVDERISDGVAEAKAYTDEKVAPIEEAIEELTEGAEVHISIFGGTDIAPDASSITGDLTKGIKKLTVTGYAPNPTSTLLVLEDNHMYSISLYDHQSNDYMLRFWHVTHNMWQYVSVYLEKGADNNWHVDATRSSILSIN